MTVLPIILVVSSVLALSYFISSKSDEISFYDSVENIEEQYRIPPHAIENLLLNTCKWPILNDEHQKLEALRPLLCPTSKYISADLDSEGFLTAYDQLSKRFPSKIRCAYYEIQESGSLGPAHEIETNKITLVSIFQFTLKCHEKMTDSNIPQPFFEKSFVNWAVIPKTPVDPNTDYFIEPELTTNPSISILLISSLSASNIRKYFPLTYKFMMENDFLISHMYNKLTNGAKENARMALLGKESNYSLFTSMKEKGCSIMLNDDTQVVNSSLFNGDVHGDFDISAYNSYNYEHLLTELEEGQCTKDGRILSSDFIENWRDYELTSTRDCHLSVNYLSTFINKDSNKLRYSDKVLRRSLESMKANDVFDSTILIIMSDEGQSSAATSYNSLIDQRNPLFSIRIPKHIREKYPNQYYFLEQNTQRLITNLDIHETLKDLANINTSPTWNLHLEKYPTEAFSDKTMRGGASLLTPRFHVENTCEDRGIPAQFCLCMDPDMQKMKTLTRKHPKYIQAFFTLTEEALEQPCIKSVDFDEENYEDLYVYSPSSMVLHNVTDLKSWKNIRRKNVVEPELEILEMGFTFESKPDKLGKTFKGRAIGQLEHDLRTGKMKLNGPIVHRKLNRRCYNVRFDRICNACYNDLKKTVHFI